MRPSSPWAQARSPKVRTSSGRPHFDQSATGTGCQLCALRCPDFAINVTSPKKKEPKGSAKASGEAKEGAGEQGEKA
jgi:coenzyme F420-reducing hydrogenase gamma subunit